MIAGNRRIPSANHAAKTWVPVLRVCGGALAAAVLLCDEATAQNRSRSAGESRPATAGTRADLGPGLVRWRACGAAAGCLCVAAEDRGGCLRARLPGGLRGPGQHLHLPPRELAGKPRISA